VALLRDNREVALCRCCTYVLALSTRVHRRLCVLLVWTAGSLCALVYRCVTSCGVLHAASPLQVIFACVLLAGLLTIGVVNLETGEAAQRWWLCCCCVCHEVCAKSAARSLRRVEPREVVDSPAQYRHKGPEVRDRVLPRFHDGVRRLRNSTAVATGREPSRAAQRQGRGVGHDPTARHPRVGGRALRAGGCCIQVVPALLYSTVLYPAVPA
jgi:hypothetical protein